MSGPNSSPAVAGFDDLVEIGRGGWSVVYSATQLGLRRRVALKVLNDVTGSPARFEREAIALGGLSDIPNIVAVHEATTAADGRPVLVMALMSTSLAGVIRAGTLPSMGELERWVPQLASALDRAHQRGTFHRDIKPGNILISSSGDAYLADFGIASLVDIDTGTTTEASLTPCHAPPERFTTADRPALAGDVYSFASTVYTALAGRPPFGTTTEGGSLGLMQRIAHDPPRPIQRPGVAVQANDVMAIGLAKDPSDRYPTASAFARALTNAIQGGAPAESTVRSDPISLAVPAASLRQDPASDTVVAPTPPMRAAPSPRRPTRPLILLGVAALLLAAGFGARTVFRTHPGERAGHGSNGTTTTTLSPEETAARQVVARRGYRPNDSVGFDSAGGLQAITATRTGSADGYDNRVFFFHAGRYLGTDAADASAQLDVTWADSDTIAVSYTLYAAEDPMCCPTDGATTVRFRWNGSRVVALDTIPPESGDRSRG